MCLSFSLGNGTDPTGITIQIIVYYGHYVGRCYRRDEWCILHTLHAHWGGEGERIVARPCAQHVGGGWFGCGNGGGGGAGCILLHTLVGTKMKMGNSWIGGAECHFDGGGTSFMPRVILFFGRFEGAVDDTHSSTRRNDVP